METVNRELVMNKIAGMSKEQVAKVLIFMAGMEAEHIIWKQRESRQQNSQTSMNSNLYFSHPKNSSTPILNFFPALFTL